MADVYGNPTTGGSGGGGYVNDLLDASVNTGGFTDSDYASFTEITYHSWTGGDLSGVWTTVLSNTGVDHGTRNPYAVDSDRQYFKFYKEVNPGVYWVLAPGINIPDGAVHDWYLFEMTDSTAVLGDRASGFYTIGGYSLQPFGLVSMDSENQYGLSMKGYSSYNWFTVTAKPETRIEAVQNEYALSWDSDLQMFRPMEVFTTVNKLRDVFIEERVDEILENIVITNSPSVGAYSTELVGRYVRVGDTNRIIAVNSDNTMISQVTDIDDQRPIFRKKLDETNYAVLLPFSDDQRPFSGTPSVDGYVVGVVSIANYDVWVNAVVAGTASLSPLTLSSVVYPGVTSSVIRTDSADSDGIPFTDGTLGAVNAFYNEAVTGVRGLHHEDYVSWDSDTNLWVPKDFRINTAKDIDFAGLDHLGTLVWDSEIQKWTTGLGATTANSFLSIERFVAIAGQTVFPLRKTPLGDIVMTRNGVVLETPAVSYDSDTSSAVYIPAGNFNETIDSDDVIQVSYVWVGVSSAASVGDLKDVDASLLAPEHGELLLWDSDLESWTGGFFTPGESQVETFVATAGQTIFSISNAASGQPFVARNGVLIPSAAISMSADGRVVTYDPAGNENSPIDSDDLVTVLYLSGTTITGWAPTALSNMGDMNIVEPMATGDILYYDVVDGKWTKTGVDTTYFTPIQTSVAITNSDEVRQDIHYNRATEEIEFFQRNEAFLKPQNLNGLSDEDWIPFGKVYTEGCFQSVGEWVDGSSAYTTITAYTIPKIFGATYEIEASIDFEKHSTASTTGFAVDYEVSSFAPDGSITVFAKGTCCSSDYTGSKTHSVAKTFYTYTDSGNSTTNTYNARIGVRVKNIDITGTPGLLKASSKAYLHIKRIA